MPDDSNIHSAIDAIMRETGWLCIWLLALVRMSGGTLEQRLPGSLCKESSVNKHAKIRFAPPLHPRIVLLFGFRQDDGRVRFKAP
jgi:hypothetical protein